jgi:acetyl esterase
VYTSYADAAAAIAAAGIVAGDPLALPLSEARARQDRYFAFLGEKPPRMARIETVAIVGPVGPIPLRLYYPTVQGPWPVALFVRGAGWWAGNGESHARTMRLFAAGSGFAVCGIDYHRTPEFKHPVQKEEVLRTIRWLHAEARRLGHAPGKLVVWGESAGANLALAAAQALRDAGEAKLRGLLLFYGNYAHPAADARPYSKWVWQQYLTDAAQRNDPHVVPLLAEMAKLPPVWLGCGEADPLLADTLALAHKLEHADVRHELKRYPGMPHAFIMLNRLLTPAVAAVDDAVRAAQGFIDKS